jgi:hypothetical protein
MFRAIGDKILAGRHQWGPWECFERNAGARLHKPFGQSRTESTETTIAAQESLEHRWQTPRFAPLRKPRVFVIHRIYETNQSYGVGRPD